MLRDATPDDVPAITEIVNHALRATTAEYREEPYDVESRRVWFAERARRGFPVVVAEVAGEVAGFATYGDFRDSILRPGFATTVEHTVHVAAEHRGAGVGRALLDELLERAHDAGIHVVVGAIDAENEVSLRLHESLGFVEVGRLPEVARTFGDWRTLVLVQRTF